jgi:hypothetical protein
MDITPQCVVNPTSHHLLPSKFIKKLRTKIIPPHHKLYNDKGELISTKSASFTPPMRGKVRIASSDGSRVINVENNTTFNGRRFTLETITRMMPNQTQMLTLNEVLDINKDVTPPDLQDYITKRGICLFGVGDGGSTLTFGEVYDSSPNDNNLFSIKPLRTVPITNDLSPEERTQYFMRKSVTINGAQYIQYYLKKTTNSEIFTELEQANYSPTVEDNNPQRGPTDILTLEMINIYTKFPVFISSNDCKEHYELHNGNMRLARFNELALYLGLPVEITDPITSEVYTDYIAVEAFSHLTFDNIPLNREGAEYQFDYWVIT